MTQPELSLSRVAAHKHLGFSDHLFDLANQPRYGDLPASIVDRGGLEPEQRAYVLRQIGRLRECRILDEHRLSYEAGVTKILASTLGEYGVVRGAVVPTLQRVFRMPQWT